MYFGCWEFSFTCICVASGLTTTNCQLSKDLFFLQPYLSFRKTGILKLAYSFFIHIGFRCILLSPIQQQQGLFKYRIQDWLGVKSKKIPLFPFYITRIIQRIKYQIFVSVNKWVIFSFSLYDVWAVCYHASMLLI